MVGYPLQDAGLMYEAETDRKMETQQIKELDWQMAWMAERSMRSAVTQFDGICETIAEAADWLEGTPEEDKLRSCLTRLEDVFTELRERYKEYERRAW